MMFQQLEETVKTLLTAIQAETSTLEVYSDAGGPSSSLNTDGKETVLLCTVSEEESALRFRLKFLMGSIDSQRSPIKATGIQQGARSGDATEIRLRAKGSKVCVTLRLHSAGTGRAVVDSRLWMIPCWRLK